MQQTGGGAVRSAGPVLNRQVSQVDLSGLSHTWNAGGTGNAGRPPAAAGRAGRSGPDSILSPDQQDGRAKRRTRFCELSCLSGSLFLLLTRHGRSHDTVARATGERQPCCARWLSRGWRACVREEAVPAACSCGGDNVSFIQQRTLPPLSPRLIYSSDKSSFLPLVAC